MSLVNLYNMSLDIPQDTVLLAFNNSIWQGYYLLNNALHSFPPVLNGHFHFLKVGTYTEINQVCHLPPHPESWYVRCHKLVRCFQLLKWNWYIIVYSDLSQVGLMIWPLSMGLCDYIHAVYKFCETAVTKLSFKSPPLIRCLNTRTLIMLIMNLQSFWCIWDCRMISSTMQGLYHRSILSRFYFIMTDFDSLPPHRSMYPIFMY